MFLNFLKNLVTYHVGVLVYFLDPVILPETKPYQHIKPKPLNANFVFTVLYLVAIVFIYGNPFMVLQHSSSFSQSSSLSNKTFVKPNSNLLLYYPAAIFPLQVWPQSEVASLIAFGAAAAVLFTFVGGAGRFSVAGRYEVKLGSSSPNKSNVPLTTQFLIINGKKLEASVSAAILKFHHRLHRWLFQAVLYIWLATIIFCYAHGILINQAYQVTSPGDALFLLFLCPLHFLYMFYGIYGVSVFVVMACTFLNIRQRHQLTRLQAIEGALTQHLNGGLKSLSTLGLKKCWLQYLSVNGSIISLMSDIERYSDLWRISLTVYFSSFISLQCYVAYIAFFMQTAYIASKFLFIFGLLELEIFQFF
ncbi:hypothetical protein TYRP_003571 [Tyrophagus putrescentiae]|nr:hypothetical protein TYRP_003571 [Tyrophagus putrescentiae]